MAVDERAPIAEIVSVGTELLLGQTIDSNSAYLGKVLAEHGVSHFRRQTVGDNLERLVEALRLALSRSDLVVTIGGLGPTQDDMTRDGISVALDSSLVHDEALEADLRELFERRGMPWVPSISRQAERPECAVALPNANGTAPGLSCQKNGKRIVALPGPPNEFEPMVTSGLVPILREIGGGWVIYSKILRVAGVGESWVEDRLSEFLASDNPTLAPYAKTGEVHLRITSRGKTKSEAAAVVEPFAKRVAETLHPWCYGEDETSLEEAVLAQFRGAKMTLACAESCTGGGLSERATSVAGSSDVFLGGVVSYSNEAKMALLGVAEEALSEHGAVSEEVALEMARGARERFGADVAVAITGIAGPGGGSEEKPVGTVFLAFCWPWGETSSLHRFGGRREAVRRRASQAALVGLRKGLLEAGLGS